MNKQQQITGNQQNQHPNNGNYDREYENGQHQQQDSINQSDDLNNQQRAYNTAQPRNLNKSNGYQRNPNYQPQRFNNNNQQQQQNQRQYDNRNRHNNRIREDMPERPKVPILSQKVLKGIDELFDDNTLDDWTKTKNQIDFNAKLNFSEDEETRSLDEFNNEKDNFKESRDNEPNANLDSNRSTKVLNEPQQNSRYRRDYQNPRPHQSYNSSNKPTYERNNYVQQSNQLNKPDNLVDDDKRTKVRSGLNDKRREDDDRKYQQPQLKSLDERNKPVLDQPQEQQPMEDRRDLNRNYNNNRNNDNYNNNNNNNNRQFQQSLPPRFQKLQQNNNSSNYNRYDQSRDRKRADSQDSAIPDDDYQNKRVLNRQTSWRNNRELSRSQDKPQQVINKDEPVKKLDDNQTVAPLENKSNESEQSKPAIENESKLNDLDLKSSTNSSLNSKKPDEDKKLDKENIASGDSVNNDLSKLSISNKNLEKPTASSAAAVKEEDKHASKQLNASQESKHSELNQSQNQNKSQPDQHQAYKKDYNLRHNNNIRNNNYDRMRSEDQHYRYQQQRDYRGGARQNDKLNKNDQSIDNRRPKKHMDYVDDYKNDYRNNRNDYNQMNRLNKYDLKKDDKYSNQQRSSAPGGNKYPDSSAKDAAIKDPKKPTISSNKQDKELNSSQNDKFDKDKKQQPQPQSRYKDQPRKSDQLDDSASSGYLPNKKQLSYNKHDNKQKIGNYDRKADNLNRNPPQQRKLSQDEETIDKVIKSNQENVKKSSSAVIKENTDQKQKTEVIFKVICNHY